MVLYMSRLERRTSVVAESGLWLAESCPQSSFSFVTCESRAPPTFTDHGGHHLDASHRAIPRPRLPPLQLMCLGYSAGAAAKISRSPRCRRDFQLQLAGHTHGGQFSGRRTCSFDCSSRSLRAYIVCRAFGLYQVPSRAPDTEATETSRCTVRDTPSPRTGRFLASASAYAPGPPVRRSSAHEPHAVAAARALLSTRADLAY